MNGDCPKCGFPLTKGNIQIVRPRGKKRPYRIHRRCPEKLPPVPPVEVKPEIFTPRQPDFYGETHSWKGTGGNPVQRPQETTGGPSLVGIVYNVGEPAYRLFMTADQAERLKAAIERNAAYGLGVGVEAIPVRADLVETEPERFADLVEVTIDWKGN